MAKLLSPLRLLAAAVVAALALTGCSPSDSAIEKALSDASAEINKTCPETVDEETRLDSTSTAPGKILQYNYTLVNIAKADLTDQQLKDFEAALKPEILTALKDNPAMKSLKDYQVTFKYSYKSSDAQDLFTLTITPADYA